MFLICGSNTGLTSIFLYSNEITSISINNNLNIFAIVSKDGYLFFYIFHYYCFGDIELYNLGLSVDKKRMDIINVFTLLLFTEKNCLKAEEYYY